MLGQQPATVRDDVPREASSNAGTGDHRAKPRRIAPGLRE
jgi:hypothetical protein